MKSNTRQQVDLKRVAAFCVLTFGLTWGFELLVGLTIKQPTYQGTQLSPLGMFFPAFSALLLETFVFKDSPLYFRRSRGKEHWVFYSFLLLTILYAVFTLLALTTGMRLLVLQGVGGVLVMLWTFVVFYIYGQVGPAGFQRVGLQLGNTRVGVRLVGGVVVFLLIQAVLNGLLGLGEFPGIMDNVSGVPVPERLYPLALFILFLISVIGTPLSGLAAVFGEEYGWRGFLQNELVKLGPRSGVFVVGLIWGIWHLPIILSGIHTYPPTVNGLFLGTVFFVLTGLVFGYAVLKTNSIWVVCFMHGVLDSVYSFVLHYLMRPYNRLFSFGLGIYGLVCLAIVVLVILQDPVWHQQATSVRTVE